MTAKQSVYTSVISLVFNEAHEDGDTRVSFSRDDVARAASKLGHDPKNIGDVIYSFRYRRPLPECIRERAPEGHVWIIRGAGSSRYRFDAVLEDYAFVRPRPGLAETKIPDATPGIIARYSLDDEQALLAKVRYNRLIDVFTGVASYSLQSHLRTQVEGVGQVETDEVYVGVDRHGAHYVFPVQAKGGDDRLNIVQIEQDFSMCAAKFPDSRCRAIAAQFLGSEKIALFLLDANRTGEAEIFSEKHYLLVPPEEITPEEIQQYRALAGDQGVP